MPNKDTNPDQKGQSGQQGQNDKDRRIGQPDQPGGGKLVLLAGFPSRPGEAAQVASVQTIHARAIRARTIELPEADIVIVDEAHHAPARTYQKILERYPNAIILGMTATPCRATGEGLAESLKR